jgi:hypothetical protein
VADVIDIAAHVRTASGLLRPGEACLAVAATEAARQCLRLDLIRHHRRDWSDVRRIMSSRLFKPN